MEAAGTVLRELRAVLAEVDQKKQRRKRDVVQDAGANAEVCVAECLRQDVGALCAGQVERFLDAVDTRVREGT